MAFVPFSNTAEFELRHTMDGQKVENTLYFDKASAWDSASLLAAADQLRDSWATNMIPLLGGSATFTEVFARDLSTAESFEATSVVSPPLTGAGGLAAPNNVTLCVSFRSGVAGRSNRGRNYWLSVPRSELVAANTLDVDYVAAIVSAYGQMQSDMGDLGYTWVIASRYHNKVQRTSGTTQVVTGILAVDGTVDSQRRRLPGRGQ